MERGCLQPKAFFERFIMTSDHNVDDSYNIIKQYIGSLHKHSNVYQPPLVKSSVTLNVFKEIVKHSEKVTGPYIFYYVYVIYLMENQAIYRTIQYFLNTLFTLTRNSQLLHVKAKAKKLYYDGMNPISVLLEVIDDEYLMTVFLITLESYFFMPFHSS